MADSAKRKRAMCLVQILRCKNCGAHAVSVNDHRITAHKCAGVWDIVRDERVEVAELHRALGKKAVNA